MSKGLIEITIELLAGLKINISQEVFRLLGEYEQQLGSNENGGVLMGKKAAGKEEYFIEMITVPTEKDRSGQSFFVRNKEAAQKIINEKWRSSEGQTNYVGEWHTHCCRSPIPSRTDHKLMKQIAKDGSSPFKHFFMIILGQDGDVHISAVDSSKGTAVATINFNVWEKFVHD